MSYFVMQVTSKIRPDLVSNLIVDVGLTDKFYSMDVDTTLEMQLDG